MSKLQIAKIVCKEIYNIDTWVIRIKYEQHSFYFQEWKVYRDCNTWERLEEAPAVWNWEAERLCQKFDNETCVESQEWTYAIDNTGTITNEDAEIKIPLSDGSTLTIAQTDQGSAGQRTPQMWERGANIQAAADAAWLEWFVDTRFIVSSGSLAWGWGFSWPPSLAVSNALYAWWMRRRYVNIQICPWQPVPIWAIYNSATRTDYNLTTAWAVLGPISKFYICKNCWEAPVRYLEDWVTPAEAWQIPNCWEPCGTLSLTDSPPDRDCEFFFAEACDNINDTDDSNRVNLVTRRATVCSWEQIAVDYFVPDPNDPNALISYTLVWKFVDCDTGEEIPLPVPECSNIEIVELFSMENVNGSMIRTERESTDPVLPQSQRWDVAQVIDMLDNFDESNVTSWPAIVAWSFAFNDWNNTPWLLDKEEKAWYIVVYKPFSMRRDTNSEWGLRIEVGFCCGDLEEQFTHSKWVGSSPSPVIDFPIWIHKFKGTNIDAWGTNSSWIAYTTDDWVDFSANNTPDGVDFSSVKPNEICKKVKVCEETGILIWVLNNLVIDPKNCYDCSILCDGKEDDWLDDFIKDVEEEVCDYNVSFKSSGINSLITDKWQAISNWPYDFSNITAWSNASNTPEIAAAEADIQAFLDANWGGTITINYPSQSVPVFSITGTSCVPISADDDSNPGPHNFTKVEIVDPELNRRCRTYANALNGNYQNWTDVGDYDDLASEFGITPSATKEMYVRVTEFVCDWVDVSSSLWATVFGGYPVGPLATSVHAFMDDFATATAGTEMEFTRSAWWGANGSDWFIISYDTNKDCTITIQEWIDDGAGGVAWFTSAWVFASRWWIVGDSIYSWWVSNPSTFNALSDPNDLENFTEWEDCEEIQ